jgi:hypothetical protein
MVTHPTAQSLVAAASTEKLQECLRSELSAVETYKVALRDVVDVRLNAVLRGILRSHVARAECLGEHLRKRGVEPQKSAGVWGVFARAVQTGADIISDRAAIAVLKEGEARGIKVYMQALDGCDARTWSLIRTKLLPAQRRTNELCGTLKDYARAPS